MGWSHDGTPFGIWDLNGNVWEWVGELRIVDGEIQVIPDNDAADDGNPTNRQMAHFGKPFCPMEPWSIPDGRYAQV